ncbi:4Fe-4S binding protein [Lachnospiraceae bacterium ZAX-1]
MPRLFCGRICPYGYLQDLIHKIPFPKKIRSFKGDKVLRYLKYVVLALLIGANFFGYMDTEIVETRTINAPMAIGFAVFLLLCIVTSRPFCKYLCPVGGVLGLFNLLPFGKYKINQQACTQCGACSRVCKMDIEPYKAPNSIECIRCGKCKKKCPCKAIT